MAVHFDLIESNWLKPVHNPRDPTQSRNVYYKCRLEETPFKSFAFSILQEDTESAGIVVTVEKGSEFARRLLSESQFLNIYDNVSSVTLRAETLRDQRILLAFILQNSGLSEEDTRRVNSYAQDVFNKTRYLLE